MIDVRNSHRQGLRRNSVLKGFRAESMKQVKYLTWYRWGHDRKNLTEAELVKEFEIEWKKIEKKNLKKYGRLDPWVNVCGMYEARLPVND